MIKENILRIKDRIISVSARCNKDPSQIAIVAISKGRSLEQIKEVIEAGVSDIGENRVQEALVKYRVLSTEYRVRLHMVGHLQTNKVKEAVKIFDLIQSVDSLHLAATIDKEAARINKIQDVLIEVKTSTEATKFGLKPEEVTEVLEEMGELKNINIKGLMTIAPLVDKAEKTRPYFRMLKELRDRLTQDSVLCTSYSVLSMGMTDDFEVAIEEGADMLRLGRAIFEG
jgi:hypothetical protein